MQIMFFPSYEEILKDNMQKL